MGQRLIRVNELLKREIGTQMHTNFPQESIYITITAVKVAPDLRNARVYFSVLGDAQNKKEATAFLKKVNGFLRSTVSDKVILKNSPRFEFVYDDSIEKGIHMMNKIDELDEEPEEEK